MESRAFLRQKGKQNIPIQFRLNNSSSILDIVTIVTS